jgi:segregation and condensation protein B
MQYRDQVMTDTPTITLSLEAQLEALLFVTPAPVKPSRLAEVMGIEKRELDKLLDALKESLRGRGIRLQTYNGSVSLTSAPEAGEVVERFLDLEATTSLSKAALETLAIIAYQQPVTRPQIDSIRGVNSDGVLRSLQDKGLVEEVGRSEGPGRPILYSTSPDFLGHFGLSGLEDLPPLDLPELPADDEAVQLKE